eukprot:162983-Chlamydomonas_euryale.AAC.1
MVSSCLAVMHKMQLDLLAKHCLHTAWFAAAQAAIRLHGKMQPSTPNMLHGVLPPSPCQQAAWHAAGKHFQHTASPPAMLRSALPKLPETSRHKAVSLRRLIVATG